MRSKQLQEQQRERVQDMHRVQVVTSESSPLKVSYNIADTLTAAHSSLLTRHIATVACAGARLESGHHQ